jgi:gephyrin
MNIRQIGSDITKGEEIVGIGQTIEPAEIGLMACAGVINVMCIRKPIIGVMSTGDELVEYHQSPQESQIRDSNRPAIIASLERDGYLVRDFGIVYDMELRLEQQILNAVSECDVLITSGGVSMGDADLVKPLLAKLGTIHFGRLNMKPGKPTTFATIKSPDVKRNIMCFGLPGNPVSCLVTKALLIEPCLKRLQGLSMDRCISPQISVRIDSDLKLDLERPEYHRARINTWGMCNGSIPTASSTGDQKSSRLLSLRASNALLCLPQGSVSKSKIFTGEIVTALITGPLPSPPINGCIYKEVIRLLSNSTSINYNEGKYLELLIIKYFIEVLS